VLDLVAAGLTNRSIATRLGISERTAREHVARIMLKLPARSRVEAAVIATQQRLRQATGGGNGLNRGRSGRSP
jgi:DNA-binding NarL/FixJ family response regulator